MDHPFKTYSPVTYSSEESGRRAGEFRKFMESRRSIRHFSNREVSGNIMENLIMTASSAPSGAHKQPWTFCLVGDAGIKLKIREAAEAEEFENYNGRMPAEWLKDLEPLQTDWRKEFLTIAPWLVVCFKKSYDLDGKQHKKNYYVNESVGIACGFFLAAVHHAGLVSLTHTPSPMDFLTKILGRPENERPYLLMPVGYPADEVTVPDIRRKEYGDVAVEFKP